MCLAVVARIEGTVVQEAAGPPTMGMCVSHPSGILPIAADVGPGPTARRATVYRPARRLMKGFVRIP